MLVLGLCLNASMLVGCVGVAGPVKPDAFDGRIHGSNWQRDLGAEDATQCAADQARRYDGEIR